MDTYLIILLLVIGCILSALVTIIIYRVKIIPALLKKENELALLKDGVGSASRVEEIKTKLKGSDEYKTALENEYRKGIEEGKKQTLQSFSITYTPFVDIKENFLKKSSDSGYIMEIYYATIPICEPMKRITDHQEKFKDENMKFIIDSVNATIQNLMLLADPLGIPIKSVSEPKISKEKQR